MSKITDTGLISAACILAAGMMFANSKDLTAWLFVLAGGYVYVKAWFESRNADKEDDDEDTEDDEDE
jgi:hypothetical protein